MLRSAHNEPQAATAHRPRPAQGGEAQGGRGEGTPRQGVQAGEGERQDDAAQLSQGQAAYGGMEGGVMLERNQVYCMDALDLLRQMDGGSVDCIVTSPPYFGLRDYGVGGQIGLEATPREYITALVTVFREARRVLRHDGTFWLNLGDSFAGGGNYRGVNSLETLSSKQRSNRGARGLSQSLGGKVPIGFKPKDLMMIPHRVAIALQEDGWWVRSDIVWSKPNPMPESVTDRPTKSHEYIFLLTKSADYWYDADAIKEPATWMRDNNPAWQHQRAETNEKKGAGNRNAKSMGFTQWDASQGRNKRSVWEVSTKPFPEAHFATFPPDLIEPCILAGCPKGGLVLDPFMGAGTTALVARAHGRDYIGSELNPEYVAIAKERLRLPFAPRVVQRESDLSGLPMFEAVTP